MQNAASLENLTLKELGAIASAAQVPRWSRLKKTELLARLQALGSAVPSLDDALKIRAEKRAAAVGAPSVVAPLIAAVELEAKRKAEENSKNGASSSKTTNGSESSKSKTTAQKTEAISKKKTEKSKNKPQSKTTEEKAPRLTEKAAQKSENATKTEPESSTKPIPTSKSRSKSSKKSALKSGRQPIAETSEKNESKFAETLEETSPSTPSTERSQNVPAPEPEISLDAPPSRVAFLKEKMRRRQTLGRETDQNDRLLLTVCDAHWLRACWEITPRLVERIRSAMGRHWHTADPTLRLYKIDREPQGATRREFVADVPIRGGVDNWYVDVDDPPSLFYVELGYLARDKQFFTLISSNVVETPRQSVVDAFGRPTLGSFDANATGFSSGFASGGFGGTGVAANGFGGAPFGSFPSSFGFDAPRTKVRSRSEKRGASESTFGDALERTYRDPNDAFSTRRDFRFEIDAEIVVKGVASPGAQVRVKEEAVRVDANGAFSVRFRLPERRHVFPVVATSADGIETQTIVLAVDRNTKTLESTFKENGVE